MGAVSSLRCWLKQAHYWFRRRLNQLAGRTLGYYGPGLPERDKLPKYNKGTVTGPWMFWAKEHGLWRCVTEQEFERYFPWALRLREDKGVKATGGLYIRTWHVSVLEEDKVD